MDSLNNLPEYLRHTVYGQIVEKHLDNHNQPNWVHNALIYHPQSVDPPASNAGEIEEFGMTHHPLTSSIPDKESNEQHMTLPTSWDTRGKPDISVSGATIQVSKEIADNKEIYLQSKGHIPRNCGTWYYEITLDPRSRMSSPCMIGMSLGLAPSRPISLMGTQNTCWLYFSDDGKIMAESGSSHQFGPGYGPGDTIGCGVNYDARSIFYTKNGIRINTAFKSLPCIELHPFIGVRAGVIFTTNFGQQDFKFDIVEHVLKDKSKLYETIDAQELDLRVMEGILGTKPESLDSYEKQGSVAAVSANSRSLADTLVSKIVANYLESMSYTKSLEAMNRHLHPDSMDVDPQDSPITTFRTQLSTAIISQEFDRAIKILQNSDYSQVLDEQLLFDLDCQRMAKAVRSDDLDTAIEIGQTLKQRCGEDNTKRKSQLTQLFGILAYTRSGEDGDVGAPYEQALYGSQALAELSTRVISGIVEIDGEDGVTFLPYLLDKIASSIESGAALGRGGNLNAYQDFCS